jgi:Flagellar biosynthesis protein, FliO
MTSTLPIPQPSPRAAHSVDTDSPMASVFARALRKTAEREHLDLSYTPLAVAPQSVPVLKKGLAPVGSPLTPGASLKKKEVPVPEPPPQQPEPQPILQAAPENAPARPRVAGGLLIRGWAWLKRNNKFAATRQLRVAETVSLGEKRFVSVIHIDGQKFLIGGGSQGVTLLTELGSVPAAPNSLQTVTNAVELSK